MADSLTLKSLVDLVQTGGPTAILLIFIWASVTGRIVPGWQYRELKKSEQKWQQLAIQAMRLGERGTRIAEKTLTADTSSTTEDTL